MDDPAPDVAPVKTYSLAEVARMVLPPELTDGVRWLSRRLNLGEIHGYKIGRVWRMTEADVAAMIDRYSNEVVKPEEVPANDSRTGSSNSVIDGLSPRSRRRLRRLP